MRVDRITVGEGGVDDFDTTDELDAQPRGSVAHALLAADQKRGAEPLVHKASGSPDHLFLLALGEHYALWLPPQPLVDALQHAGDGIAPVAQLLAVSIHVDDGLARDAGIHGGFGNGRRNRRDQARIKWYGDDVVGPVFRPCAVGGGDL